jgi:hypothetical protein
MPTDSKPSAVPGRGGAIGEAAPVQRRRESRARAVPAWEAAACELHAAIPTGDLVLRADLGSYLRTFVPA